MTAPTTKRYGFEYKMLGWFIILFCLTVVTLNIVSTKGLDEVVYQPEYIDSISIRHHQISRLITSKPTIKKLSVALKSSKRFRQCDCKGGHDAIKLAFYSTRNNVSEFSIQYYLNMPPRILSNSVEYSNDTFIYLIENIIDTTH